MGSSWQFHFRNFDTAEQWFGVYHAGCGGAPWHEGRPKCWDCSITDNPTGGDSSVYVPAKFVVNFDQWFKVIIDGIEEVGDILMVIASEGEDADAWKEAISKAFGIGQDIVDAAVTNSGVDLDTLMQQSQKQFATAASSIGKTTDEILQIGAGMGISNFGFLAGQSYVSMIHDDNTTINDNYGWTILRSGPDTRDKVDHILNHAFIDQGHLIIYWNSNDMNGFWEPYS